MIPSLGFGPLAILQGAPERLQTYAIYGFWAARGLQSKLPAAQFLPWLARGCLSGHSTPQADQPNSSLLSHGLGSGLRARARNTSQ